MTDNDKLFLEALQRLPEGSCLETSSKLLSEELLDTFQLDPQHGGKVLGTYVKFVPMFRPSLLEDWMK